MLAPIWFTVSLNGAGVQTPELLNFGLSVPESSHNIGQVTVAVTYNTPFYGRKTIKDQN